MYERRPGFFREDTPPGRRVDAIVKWFNASKGFGFVTLGDGTADAFLPMATLRRAGYEDVREGASLSCEISDGAKGPLVVNVHAVDHRTSVPAPAGPAGKRLDRGGPRSAVTIEGAVKWFEPERGFGFVSPDNGGKDVYIHITALRRSGVEALDAGQRVRVDVVDGKKGLEAERLSLL